jgi:hypothetical protein
MLWLLLRRSYAGKFLALVLKKTERKPRKSGTSKAPE